ncbi:MAG: DNA polymerase, partial [Candidatus Enteromonas sp.]|nr:DNA polymerase [Candidatus Enteromonas sp.]
MNGKRLYCIDGNSLLFRAFYATYFGDPSTLMRTKDGRPSNAIFAFSNMLCKLLSLLEPGDLIFLAFDKDSQTFRKEEFEGYKANRKATPEELKSQFAPARDLVRAMGIPMHEEHGVEADDLCGSAAKLAEKEGYQVEIYTSDKDYLQLVSSSVTVHLLKKGFRDLLDITPESMVENFGFSPLQIIDYKGLRGDASDNLPGIPGVGDKTATKLIAEYGSFDAIMEAARAGTIKGKLGENLIAGEPMGRLCYNLATIKTDCPLPFGLSEMEYRGYSPEEVAHFAESYELKSLLSKMPKSAIRSSSSEENTLPPLSEDLSPLWDAEAIGIAIDGEETYHTSPFRGIGLATKTSRHYVTQEELLQNPRLIALLESPLPKYGYDLKAIACSLKKVGISLSGLSFSLELAAYLLDSTLGSDSHLVLGYFGVSLPEEDSNLLSFGYPETTSTLAAYSLLLQPKALAKLQESGNASLYFDIELPLLSILANMENEGFPCNGEELAVIGEEFRKKKDALEREIASLAGHPFNISSPKQVASVLYDELLLRGPKSRSTSIEELKKLIPLHPIVGKILEYRKYAKLVGTYIDGILPHIDSEGKIHTVFHQTQTATGRLSSSDPNLQNISTRDEESKEIRKAFHYSDGTRILSLDYSQIELRILASLSGCSSYISVFQSGRDVHSETARAIFHIPEGQEVPHELRRKAKAINFA